MSKREIKVYDISFKLGETDLTLTVDEAKKLQALLNELFPSNATVYVPVPEPFPQITCHY